MGFDMVNMVCLVYSWRARNKPSQSLLFKTHCVVPENVHTPHGKFFLRPLPQPLGIFVLGGILVPPPPLNFQIFKRLFLFPYTMSYRKGFLFEA